MYAVICKPDVFPHISKAVEGLGEIVFKRLDNFDSQTLRQAFQELGRISIDALIYELDSGPSDSVLAVLRAYRLARPTTRIIILAPGRSSGDRLISNLLPMHIYDILSPGSTTEPNWDLVLSQVLQSPPATYAEVARWHLLDSGTETSVPGKSNITTEIVFQDRILGPVILAVVSLASGLGCTFASMALADYLAKKNYKVALADLCDGNSFFALVNVLGLPELEDGKGFKLNNFDIYPNAVQNKQLDRIIDKSYNYIIIDSGSLPSIQTTADFYSEIKRANLTIAVGSTAPWRWKDFAPLTKDYFEKWRILIPGGLPEHNKEFADFFTEGKTFFIPITNSPFDSSDQRNEVFGQLLKPVLPRKPKTKSSAGFSILTPLRNFLFKNSIS